MIKDSNEEWFDDNKRTISGKPLTEVFVETKSIKQIEKALDDKNEYWIIVIGIAGTGKSSLLWYFYKKMKNSKDKFPVMINAREYFYIKNTRGNANKLILQAKRLRKSGKQLVVFIDTVDYLISQHDKLNEFMTFRRLFTNNEVKVVIFSRPNEWEMLKDHLNRKTPTPIEHKGFECDDENKVKALGKYLRIHYDYRDEERIQRKIQYWKKIILNFYICVIIRYIWQWRLTFIKGMKIFRMI